ncbi:TPA: hypothetical protein DCY65_00350 [Candidatus Acetothermia bacterium]|nr:hypothetical protein [Candidatus Acetothermia bacterium]HAZ30013.1 hypothetical protein [Candidatus Acetothermia bacterium]
MPPKQRSGRTFDPYREALRSLAVLGGLGFVVVGGALAGFGLGYGLDVLMGGRVGRIAGIVLGVASGIWAAGRQLMRVIKDRPGGEGP